MKEARADHVLWFWYISWLDFITFFWAKRDGTPVVMLENVSSKGHVRVNGKTLDKDSDIVLTGGDEVVFSSTGRHAYVSFLWSLQVVKLVIL